MPYIIHIILHDLKFVPYPNLGHDVRTTNAPYVTQHECGHQEGTQTLISVQASTYKDHCLSNTQTQQ